MKPDTVVISDLLDVIHYAIIKKYGENTVILKQLQEIDEAIQSGKLENIKVEGVPFWETIKNSLR